MNPAWKLERMSRPTHLIYKTWNRAACNEALKRRGSLTIRFDSVMTWEAKPTGKCCRQADIVTRRSRPA